MQNVNHAYAATMVLFVVGHKAVVSSPHLRLPVDEAVAAQDMPFLHFVTLLLSQQQP
jgi:hypothetical protein